MAARARGVAAARMILYLFGVRGVKGIVRPHSNDYAKTNITWT